MGDIIQGKGPQNPQVKYKDMGDGTHAEVVYATGLTIEGGVTVDNSGVETRLGAINEAAATADDSSSGLNGLMKRLLARIAVLLDRLPASLSSGRLAVKSDVSLNAGAVDATTQRITVANDGPLMTTLQATDTAAAGADGTGNYGVVAALKRGLLNWASLLGRIPAALVGGRFSVASSVPHMSTGVIMSAQTAATGTNWTAFNSQACVALDIVNNTGTTVEYRRGAAGTAMQIPAGAARMVIGITNANQIDVRRTDTSNTQVTVQAEAFQH